MSAPRKDRNEVSNEPSFHLTRGSGLGIQCDGFDRSRVVDECAGVGGSARAAQRMDSVH